MPGRKLPDSFLCELLRGIRDARTYLELSAALHCLHKSSPVDDEWLARMLHASAETRARLVLSHNLALHRARIKLRHQEFKVQAYEAQQQPARHTAPGSPDRRQDGAPASEPSDQVFVERQRQ